MRRQINLDLGREERLGFAETVFAEGKSPAQLAEILSQVEALRKPMLFTRLAPEKYEALPAEHLERIDFDPVSRTAFFGEPRPCHSGPKVAVITAGSSDVPVASEARRTLQFHGYRAIEINDVGVAGIHRLLDRIEEIRRLPIVIGVAGMDAALVSVLGGIVPGTVIAVPTSVGYGVAAGGWTALRSALGSCAPGIVSVNIDNGYGAAMAAIRILRHLG